MKIIFLFVCISIILCACPSGTDNFTPQILFDIPLQINQTTKIAVGDTLWFEVDIANIQKDVYTNKEFNITNPTFVFDAQMETWRGENNIKTLTDNVEIVTRVGELDIFSLHQVYGYSIINFDFRFGCNGTNRLIFGIVSKQKGIFSLNCWGKVYYGDNKTLCNDYSYSNSQAYINFVVDKQQIDWNLFDNLTLEEKGTRGAYYTETQRKNLNIFFFEFL